MDDLSDTESESSASAAGWDAADFMQMAAELGRIEETPANFLDLRNAFETLSSLDICAVETDEQMHEVIQRVSNSILSFLDCIATTDQPHAYDLEEMRRNLSVILNECHMALLLEYRTLFRTIASRNLEGSTTAIAVCWVDIILARLGQAVVNASGLLCGVQPSDQDLPEALRAQKTDDMLRAAVQLPEKWSGIQQLLCSEHASPAAIRLAFSLVWGMTVMATQLAESDQLVQMEGLFKVLEQRIKQRDKKIAQGTDMHRVYVNENERVMYAMLVSLYAFADPASILGVQSPCRPQTHATLLELIRLILHPEDTSSIPCGVYPVTELDIPRTILLKWGCALPWSWRIWNDSRLHHSEVAETLTATWLHHLEVPAVDIPSGHSLDWWDNDLVYALESDSYSALSMMSRLLLAVLVAKDTIPATYDDVVRDVLLKACWSINYLSGAGRLDEERLCALYGILFELFLRIGEQELELAVKDLIVESLSFSTASLRLAATPFDDPHLEHVLAWRRRLSRMNRSVAPNSDKDDISTLELRNIRQTLQFLTLAWSVDCTAGVLPESRLLFSSLLDWLESEPLDSLVWTMLGDATFGALALSPHLAASSESQLGVDFIWDLLQDVDATDLPLAASLSTYVAATVTKRIDNLAYAEAWNYFRDVVLLILNREFVGAAEPLALLVCPSICRVLVALLQHAPPGPKRYMLASPWTGCMIMHMKNVSVDHPAESVEYNAILGELIGSSVEALCEQLAAATSTAPTTGHGGSNPSATKELTYCWHESRPCLITA
ncbi:hypothetical protein C2E23DRAFT_801926 [Lenzites betulinus]|nr:hypothetical protein C2E23DRAFT_801926 [Lenzites betulinus]